MNPHSSPTETSVTLNVPGDLVSTNAETLNQQASSLFETVKGVPPQWKNFTLDLSAAKMIDSVGLNLVVTLLKRVQKCGGKMQVAYSSPNILRTFTFTRLDRQVELVKV